MEKVERFNFGKERDLKGGKGYNRCGYKEFDR